MWLVSTALNSGSAELHHPQRNIIMAFASICYSAFQTSKMQWGSAVYWPIFRMYIIHTPVLQPRCKEIDATLVSVNTFNLLLGCAICLAAQAVLDILSLSPVSDAYKTFRIGTFVQDANRGPCLSILWHSSQYACFSHKLNNVTCSYLLFLET